MRKCTLAAVVIAACFLLLSAFQHPTARVSLKYGDRLQELVGKRFGIAPERDSAQLYETGEYTLKAVGVDYAEFHSDRMQVLIPLSVLRVAIEAAR